MRGKRGKVAGRQSFELVRKSQRKWKRSPWVPLWHLKWCCADGRKMQFKSFWGVALAPSIRVLIAGNKNENRILYFSERKWPQPPLPSFFLWMNFQCVANLFSFFSHHIPLAFLHLLCSFLPRLLPPPLARHNKNNNNNPGYAAKGWLTHIYVSSLEAIIAVA